MMSGGSVTGSSPLRERFGAMKRKDATGTSGVSLYELAFFLSPSEFRPNCVDATKAFPFYIASTRCALPDFPSHEGGIHVQL